MTAGKDAILGWRKYQVGNRCSNSVVLSRELRNGADDSHDGSPRRSGESDDL